VEHVERQDEREAALRADADKLEKQGDELEQKGDQLEGQIDEVRDDFERKKQSPEVPGAQDQDANLTGSEEAESRLEASGQPGDVEEDE
jgi:hypothetical protein